VNRVYPDGLQFICEPLSLKEA